MEVHVSSAVPVPVDRIVMVFEEGTGLWEFALWAPACHLRPDGSLGDGWCVSDHESLRWSVINDDTAEIASSVIERPVYWAEVPGAPVVAVSETVLTA